MVCLVHLLHEARLQSFHLQYLPVDLHLDDDEHEHEDDDELYLLLVVVVVDLLLPASFVGLFVRI